MLEHGQLLLVCPCLLVATLCQLVNLFSQVVHQLFHGLCLHLVRLDALLHFPFLLLPILLPCLDILQVHGFLGHELLYQN